MAMPPGSWMLLRLAPDQSDSTDHPDPSIRRPHRVNEPPAHLPGVLAELVLHPEKTTALSLETALSLLALVSGVREILKARVTALQVDVASRRNTAEDRLLDVNEAARRLNVSADRVYRNHNRYPFTVRNGRKLGFSERGLAAYLQRAQERAL